MSLLCSVRHIFTPWTRLFSSIQLLVNKKLFHQSSFKFIKSVFISPASIYALFTQLCSSKSGEKVLGEKPGGKVLDSTSPHPLISLYVYFFRSLCLPLSVCLPLSIPFSLALSDHLFNLSLSVYV